MKRFPNLVGNLKLTLGTCSLASILQFEVFNYPSQQKNKVWKGKAAFGPRTKEKSVHMFLIQGPGNWSVGTSKSPSQPKNSPSSRLKMLVAIKACTCAAFKSDPTTSFYLSPHAHNAFISSFQSQSQSQSQSAASALGCACWPVSHIPQTLENDLQSIHFTCMHGS